jgi:hypothetical protein
MRFRTKTYDSIVRILSDLRWHEVDELRPVTRYPEDWVRELTHDPGFDVDAHQGRLRLRVPAARRQTPSSSPRTRSVVALRPK